MRPSRRHALLPADAAARLRTLALGALVLLLLAVPATAVADGSQLRGLVLQSPSNNSAGDQYVETLPSPKGPKTADGKKDKRRSNDLPPKIKQKLLGQGGSSAAKLIEIATSPQLGAPELKNKLDNGGGKRKSHRSGRSQTAVPSAAIDAVGGGQAGLGWLVLALLVITALALGAVGYQRYRDKDASG